MKVTDSTPSQEKTFTVEMTQSELNIVEAAIGHVGGEIHHTIISRMYKELQPFRSKRNPYCVVINGKMYQIRVQGECLRIMDVPQNPERYYG